MTAKYLRLPVGYLPSQNSGRHMQRGAQFIYRHLGRLLKIGNNGGVCGRHSKVQCAAGLELYLEVNRAQVGLPV